jgi:hypothetical protein
VHLPVIFLPCYIPSVAWEVEFTEEFERRWSGLTEDEQIAVAAKVKLLEEKGPNLPHPHSSGIQSSKHKQMRELIIQCHGEPFRVLYAFDSRRVAILLIGGNKTGDNRWYETSVPLADRLYDAHLATLQAEATRTSKEVKDG